LGDEVLKDFRIKLSHESNTFNEMILSRLFSISKVSLLSNIQLYKMTLTKINFFILLGNS